jgi:hypothetical protein
MYLNASRKILAPGLIPPVAGEERDECEASEEIVWRRGLTDGARSGS